jgi:hypothetical protein
MRVSPRQVLRNARPFDSASVLIGPLSQIILEEDCIARVTAEPLQVDDAQVIDAGDRVVLPGLIDAHVPVVVASHDPTALRLQPPSLVTAQASASMRGITAVRIATDKAVLVVSSTDLPGHLRDRQSGEFDLPRQALSPVQALYSTNIVVERLMRVEGEIGERVPGCLGRPVGGRWRSDRRPGHAHCTRDRHPTAETRWQDTAMQLVIGSGWRSSHRAFAARLSRAPFQPPRTIVDIPATRQEPA